MGFVQAGFEILWANEFDHQACKTYRCNFHNDKMIQGDIRRLNTADLSTPDVLIAGFPCQPFSVMGRKKGFDDPRGSVFFETSRIIEATKPRFILFENVENLLHHDFGKSFLVIYNTLARLGYAVRYKVMNALDVNIPQNRARLFIVGFLNINECDKFRFPEPQKLTRSAEEYIDRSVKHDVLYYYLKNSKYFDVLNQKVENRGIYRIDDSGIANKKSFVTGEMQPITKFDCKKVA